MKTRTIYPVPGTSKGTLEPSLTIFFLNDRKATMCEVEQENWTDDIIPFTIFHSPFKKGFHKSFYKKCTRRKGVGIWKIYPKPEVLERIRR